MKTDLIARCDDPEHLNKYEVSYKSLEYRVVSSIKACLHSLYCLGRKMRIKFSIFNISERSRPHSLIVHRCNKRFYYIFYEKTCQKPSTDMQKSSEKDSERMP